MQRTFLALVLATALGSAGAAEYTYRGTLYDGGQPANGAYTLRLTPYAAERGGLAIAGPQTLHAVEVIDGKLAAGIELDTTAGNGEIWFDVEIAGTGDGGFTKLPAREAATTKAAGVCWSTSGNPSTNPLVDFVGTTDTTPLHIGIGATKSASFFPNFNFGSGEAYIFAPDSNRSAILGGTSNFVGSQYNVILGGQNNVAGTPTVDADEIISAIVAGGAANEAAASYSAIVGGKANVTSGNSSIAGGNGSRAQGEASVALGQSNCSGGRASVALGTLAKVRAVGAQCGAPGSGDLNGDEGTFVWADAFGGNFISTGPNQFLIRANGGVGINARDASLMTKAELALRGRAAEPGDLLIVSGRDPDIGTAAVGHRFESDGRSMSDATLRLVREKFGITNSQLDLAHFDMQGSFQVFGDAIKPGGGTWAAPSDARLKSSIQPLRAGILDRLLSLRGVNFEYRRDIPSGYYVAGEQTGFVAQEVEKVFPDWVTTDAAGYRLVAPRGFEAMSVEAMRELRVENEALEQRVEALERQLRKLLAESRQ